MRTLLLTLLIIVVMPGCATPLKELSPEDERSLEAEGTAAWTASDYGKVIELAMPRALAGDPEFQFSVGYAMLEWIHDPKAKETPKYSTKDALSWIYKAAEASVPQAAGILSSAYRFGNFTLPKNSMLSECWRKVEIGEQTADICVAAEQPKFKP